MVLTHANDSDAGVLVIDDDPLMGRALVRWLSRWEARCCTSGAEALELLEHHRFALVLCDLGMPDVSGAQVYSMVRAANPDQAERFVFMSGGTHEDRHADFLARVDNPVLDKPFSPEDLDAVLVRFGLTEADPQP